MPKLAPVLRLNSSSEIFKNTTGAPVASFEVVASPAKSGTNYTVSRKFTFAGSCFEIVQASPDIQGDHFG